MVASAVAVGRQGTHLPAFVEEARMQTARLAERIPFAAPVELLAPGAASPWSVAASDVSETGIFVRTAETFSTGELLSLRFEVEGTPVHVRAAEVVWTRRVDALQRDGRPPGLGLRFVSIEPSSRAAIARLVNRTLAQSRVEPRPLPATEPSPAEARRGAATTAQATSLPAPQLTLPPLSPSIIEQSGARDVEDTQDLLPPVSLRRRPDDDDAVSLAPARTVEVSLPPDEPNLSTESRVFAGIPATPRPVSLTPALDLTRTPIGPRSVTMGPQPAAPPIDLRDRTVTPRLFTVPPGFSLTPWVGSTGSAAPSLTPFHQVGGLATLSSITTLPPASPGVSALMQPAPASALSASTSISTSSSSVEAEAPDLFVGWSFRRTEPQPTPASREHGAPSRMPSEAPSTASPHDAPLLSMSTSASCVSVDESGATTPGGPAHSSLPIAVAEGSDAYSLGPAIGGPAADAGPRLLGGPLDDAEPRDFMTSDGERSAHRRELARARRRRSAWMQALGVVALGCTAGAVVVLWEPWSTTPSAPHEPTRVALSAPVEAATTAEPTTAEPSAAHAPRADLTAPPAPAPRPVELAEAELRATRGREGPSQPSPTMASPTTASVTTVTPASEHGSAPSSAAPGPSAQPTVTAPAEDLARRSEPATSAALAALGGRHVVELPRAGVVRKAFALAGPARVVVDLEDAALPSTAIQVGKGGVEAVRFGQPEPHTQRVVLVLDGAHKPDAVEARIEEERLIVSWQR
jgi:Tfp pilus assembly protein PilZ